MTDAATMIDSAVFGNLFSTSRMRQVFCDESRIRRYLEVEAALARAQGRLGVIPREAADEIARNCDIGIIDSGELARRTEQVGFPIVPVVAQLTAACSGDHGGYVHWGATTQDIIDTATVLQIREALEEVDEALAHLSGTLAKLAREHRNTPMIGRTNLQQAIPITFGYKMAVLLATVERHRQRLRELRPRVLVGEFGGAVGTLASLGDDGIAVRRELMAELSLGEPAISWHTARDGFAEVGCFLGMVAATMGKVATDVKLLMQTEVGEAAEPKAPGRGSSSTMPHKRNPVACSYVLACAASARQLVASMLEAVLDDHERGTGPWQTEWFALPELFCVTSGALAHTVTILDGIEVDAAAMRGNIELTGGLVFSEAVMMALAPTLGRGRAHELVTDLCKRAVADRRSLVELVHESSEINEWLSAEQIAALFDPSNYLGQAGPMIDAVLGAI